MNLMRNRNPSSNKNIDRFKWKFFFGRKKKLQNAASGENQQFAKGHGNVKVHVKFVGVSSQWFSFFCLWHTFSVHSSRVRVPQPMPNIHFSFLTLTARLFIISISFNYIALIEKMFENTNRERLFFSFLTFFSSFSRWVFVGWQQQSAISANKNKSIFRTEIRIETFTWLSV